MTTAILQTTYFGPVQWYQKLKRFDHCLIEQYDSYQKQTYRNRCIIATTNGLQALTVPVEHTDEKALVKDLRISDHNQWRRIPHVGLQRESFLRILCGRYPSFLREALRLPRRFQRGHSSDHLPTDRHSAKGGIHNGLCETMCQRLS